MSLFDLMFCIELPQFLKKKNLRSGDLLSKFFLQNSVQMQLNKKKFKFEEKIHIRDLFL